MRRFVWVIGLAVCLWPLLSGGATRDEFLVRPPKITWRSVRRAHMIRYMRRP